MYSLLAIENDVQYCIGCILIFHFTRKKYVDRTRSQVGLLQPIRPTYSFHSAQNRKHPQSLTNLTYHASMPVLCDDFQLCNVRPHTPLGLCSRTRWGLRCPRLPVQLHRTCLHVFESCRSLCFISEQDRNSVNYLSYFYQSNTRLSDMFLNFRSKSLTTEQ